MENVLRAGFHSMVITLPLGLDIPGYYHSRFADGADALLRELFKK